MGLTYKGRPHDEGQWTGWYETDDHLINEMVDSNGWRHKLITDLGESNPDANHIHIKARADEKMNEAPVLCSVKIDGMHPVNRRRLIQDINDALDMNIPYR